MTTAKKSDILWVIARLFLGLVFTYAGFQKAVEPVQNFQAVVLDYEIFPYAWSLPIAYVMPWVELILGVFLIVGYLPRWSALGIGVLSVSFIALITASYIKLGGFPKSCGCFGAEGLIQLKPYQVLILDVVDTFLAVKLWKRAHHPWSLEQKLKESS